MRDEKVMKGVFFKILSLAAMTVLMACGHQNSQSIPYPYGQGYMPNCVGFGCTTVPTGVGTTSTMSVAAPFTTGDTEVMNVVNNGILGEYLGYPVQNPGPVQVNISVTPQNTSHPMSGSTSSRVFLGTLTIRFQDGTVLHNGTFSNGSDPNQTYNSDKTYYNNVSAQFGNTYRIFFEDPAGALVLTVNGTAGTDTSTAASGQIWFYNFPNTGAPNPLFSGAYDKYGNYFPPGDVFCWEIDLGPYNCQNFNLPPNSGSGSVPAFTLLGTIPTINLSSALGI